MNFLKFCTIFLLFHAGKSVSLKENEIEIQALLDYETGLIFYKDDSIPACFVESFSEASFGSPILRIPDTATGNSPVGPGLNLSDTGLLFCQDSPVIWMGTILKPQHPLKYKGRFYRGKVRRKRQSYASYRNGHEHTGETRAQGNWNMPGQASQAQVQGQVFGTGMFSGQAQTQNGGMSQSQVQLSGVGIRGQISSSSGNAQAQLSLGQGVGSGQASGLGEGPSRTQVQVTLGQGDQESMASASATSGGAFSGVGGGPMLRGGGAEGYYYPGGHYAQGNGGTASGYRNGNGHGYGQPYRHELPTRGQYYDGGGQYRQDDRRGAPQQTSNYYGGGGQTPIIPERSSLQAPGFSQLPQTSQNGHGLQQTDPGVGFGSHSGYGMIRTNGFGAGLGGASGAPINGRGFDQNLGSPPARHTASLGNVPGTSQRRVFDPHPQTALQGTGQGYGDQGSLRGSRLSPGGVGAGNGYGRIQITNDVHRGTPGPYSNGFPTTPGGRPFAQSSTPGAYAASHGVGQAQAQTAYFRSVGNGQYAPYRVFQDSQPGRGRTDSDGVQRYQDQQVGYGAVGQRQQVGGAGIPTSSQNGYRDRVSPTNGRYGLATTTTYQSRSNGHEQHYSNGGGTGSTIPRRQVPASITPTSGSGHGGGGGLRTDQRVIAGATPAPSGQAVPSRQTQPGYLPVSTLPFQPTGQQSGLPASPSGRNGYGQPSFTSPSHQHQLPAPVIRNGQPYRINGLGQIIPAGQSSHPISPTTTTITGAGGDTEGRSVSHTSTATLGQSGFFPSYGVSQASPDDPDGKKCTIITFSCTIVIESNGRAKICKPNAVRVNGASGQQSSGGAGSGANGSKICCC